MDGWTVMKSVWLDLQTPPRDRKREYDKLLMCFLCTVSLAGRDRRRRAQPISDQGSAEVAREGQGSRRHASQVSVTTREHHLHISGVYQQQRGTAMRKAHDGCGRNP